MFKTLTPTLSIIAAILLFVFFIQPQLGEIDKINMQISEYRTTIAQHVTFRDTLDTLIEKKNFITTSNLERLSMMIPDVSDETQTLVDLEAMARRNGLLFGNVSTDVEEIDNTVNDLFGFAEKKLAVNEVSFEVIGTYEQFKAFLSEIESSLQFMEVTALSLTAATDAFQQYKITVETYSLPKS